MSRPGVTYEDVCKAAVEIEAQGERPTVERVRVLTGGSASTVLRHIQALRAEANGVTSAAGGQATRAVELRDTGGGPIDPDRALSIADAIRATALAQIETALASERQRHEAERRVLAEAHRAEITALHDAAQAQAQTAEVARQSAAAELADLAAAAESDQVEADTRIEALEVALGQAKGEVEQYAQEIREVRASLVQAQGELRELRAVLIERQAELQAERDRAEREATARIEAERRAAGAESQSRVDRERADREAVARVEAEPRAAAAEAQSKLDRERAEREATARLDAERRAAAAEERSQSDRQRAEREEVRAESLRSELLDLERRLARLEASSTGSGADGAGRVVSKS
jgi:hypothetical protein